MIDDLSNAEENLSSDVEYEDYLQHERKKPDLKDFTLSEYTEKGINLIKMHSINFLSFFLKTFQADFSLGCGTSLSSR